MTVCVVFTGPTLSAQEGRSLLDALYLPPVAQGDVYRVAIGRRPRAIGIIDGYFERVPAVWHKEILWAMTQGIHVYGSASMGALRAAELTAFGMEGVGEVFGAFRDGTLEDDDEVAVVHGPAETGYRPASEAMVNVRATLVEAEKLGVVDAGTRSHLERIAKGLFYPERCYPSLLERAAEDGLPVTELDALRAWLPHGRRDQKRRDALEMLRTMRRHLKVDPGPKRVSFALEHTTRWEEVRNSAVGHIEETTVGDTAPITLDSLLAELRLDGNLYARARQGATARHLALEEARRRGYAVGADAVEKMTARFRRRRGLVSPEDLDRWLVANDLSRGRFDELMREEVLLDLVRAHTNKDGTRRMADHLRLSGEYERLLSRARGKQRTLEAHGLQNPGLADTGATARVLLDWYYDERLPRTIDEDRQGYTAIVEPARENVAAFTRALLREYCYLRLGQPTDTTDGGDA